MSFLPTRLAKIPKDDNVQPSQFENLLYTYKDTNILGYVQKAVYCGIAYSDGRSWNKGLAEWNM